MKRKVIVPKFKHAPLIDPETDDSDAYDPQPSNNPKGRPSKGLTEARVLVTGPKALLDAVEEQAASEGVTTRETWRRAARHYLGLR